MKQETIYDQIYYEETYGETYAAKQQQWLDDYFAGKSSGFTTRINFMLEHFGELPENGTVLDLGCGVGTFALVFAQQGFRTTGLDISEASIEACRANAVRWQLDHLAGFVCGSSVENHFEEGSFDSILAADIIEHLPPLVLEKTLANCFRWLKPHGKLYIHTTPTKYYYLITNKPSVFLFPAQIFPNKIIESYVKFLDKTVIQGLYWLRFGKTYNQIVARTGHCNPPHPIQFEQIVRESGLTLIDYQLLDKTLSGLSYDQPRYNFGYQLVERTTILRPAIICIAQKI